MAEQIKTDRQAKTIAVPGRHGIGVPRANLRVQIRVSGGVIRSYQWTPAGRPAVTIGSPNAVSLKAAREAARSFNDALALGRDPAVEKRTDAMTFSKVAEECIESLRGGWDNPRTEANWRYSLLTHAAILRDRPIAGIGVDDILTVLRPLWGQRETANKVRRRLEAVLDFARARGYRPPDSPNPAVWRSSLRHILPKQTANVAHHPAVPVAGMPAFMAELSSKEGLPWRGIEMLALTAARYDQVHRAEWSELDLDARLWTVPAARCKRRAGQPRKSHVIPLSEAACAVLARIPRTGARLFPLGVNAMRRCMATLPGGFHLHGFRSAFSDWAHDRTTFPSDLIEECLDHLVGSSVTRAYRRGAQDYGKRRAVFEAWGSYITGSATVVPLRAAS